ncbi:unnamed protein product, partial [Ectocarpus sp. 12 AP-2014]
MMVVRWPLSSAGTTRLLSSFAAAHNSRKHTHSCKGLWKWTPESRAAPEESAVGAQLRLQFQSGWTQRGHAQDRGGRKKRRRSGGILALRQQQYPPMNEQQTTPPAQLVAWQ